MTHEEKLKRFGFRFGRNGPHAARTMMLKELETLFSRLPVVSTREDYRREVVDHNALGKPTKKSRELTFGYLVDLYGFEPGIPLFRAFRKLWGGDEQARPVLALMMALARDVLLRRSRALILAKRPGETVQREEIEQLLAREDPGRFSPASLKSFAQNLNGTWTQAGFLSGHVRKTRSVPKIGPTVVTFALFLGYLEGLTGQRLFASEWTTLIPGSLDELDTLAQFASKRGEIVFMNAGGVKEVRFPGYLTSEEERWRPDAA